MVGVFTLLLFICFIAIIVGLIKPKAVILWGKPEKKTRGRVLLTYILGMIACFILIGVTAPKVETTKPAITQSSNDTTASLKTDTAADDKAKKEADAKAKADEKAQADAKAKADAEAKAFAAKAIKDGEAKAKAEADAKAKAEAAKPKLEVIESKSENDKYSRYVVGTVKNNTNKEYGYVQVEINLYDESGAQVGSTLANANNLEAGGTWKFKAPILEESAKTFKIKDVNGF